LEGVSSAGADAFRLMLFKPRTTHDSFQGIGLDGIPILEEVKRRYPQIPIISEPTRVEHVDVLASLVDAFQIGTRSATNYELLEAAAMTGKPIVLKRGMGQTIEEWLGSASYVLENRNQNLIFCERGIRTFEHSTRFTLDISAVPVLKERTPYPVIVDPSHSAGSRAFVPALARAAIASGADGIEIDVHIDPESAYVDGPQQLTIEHCSTLLPQLRKLAETLHGD
ncbi:MAG: N-acetylneuraminate synthase family protein, partial [Parcubacteria group bacterium]|nr:N-acetylneuraminate synthase family protein [Parcubacteria group bacterium]